jgi:hypothetical protein
MLERDVYVTTAEAAYIRGWKPPTAQKWAHEGWFPSAKKLGNNWLLLLSEVLDFARFPNRHAGRPRKEKK